MTRSFLAQIQSYCPYLPMFVLTDFDPDGLNIFLCYLYGTTSFSHESSNTRINLGRLGIQSNDLGSLYTARLDGSRSGSQNQEWSDNCLVNLTPRDRISAIGMLRKACALEGADHLSAFVRREFQVMLILGTKAEIQALDDSGDITPWLDTSLQRALNIIS